MKSSAAAWRATFAGGASLNYAVARFFCALGINILQLYGPDRNLAHRLLHPHEGQPSGLRGPPGSSCEVKLGQNDELLVRGPQMMKGYWNRPARDGSGLR